MQDNKIKDQSTHCSKHVLPAVVGSQTKYQIVYADPAWDFGDRLKSSKKLDNGKMHFREFDLHYKTMKTNETFAL